MTLRPYERARLLAALLAGALSAPAAAQTAAPPAAAPPPDVVQKSVVKAGPISTPIEIRSQFLGKSGEKTVVRFVLSVSRAELHASGADQPRVYSFSLVGEVRDASDAVVETFRVPVDADLSTADAGRPLSASFLRSLPPGVWNLRFSLEGLTGKGLGVRAVSLTVPAMSSEFRAEDAGVDAAGQPSAAAIVLESENREAAAGAGGLVKLLPPPREAPIGLLLIEAEVKPPVTRVEFWLEEKKLVAKNRPPYSVELDIGKIPKKQTLKALGFDARGNFVDADAWAINERDARLAVRILELPKRATTGDATEVKVTVQSIAGGEAKTVRLFADDEKLHEWTAPPYTATVPAARLAKATLLRATAVDQDGKEFSDFRFLKGDARFLSKAEVNVVELNVTVVDSSNRFAKGLARDDFEVLEDGGRQTLGSFEFAESLPLSLGIVIDGSGSMKDSIALVHQAAGDFVQKLVGEKDQGFVLEFRESPTLLSPMTKKASDLVRAIAETRASGGTALYDSIVMALYQFRATPGKKALVILTDGKDNHSWADYETLRRYVRTSGVPVFFIGLDISFLEVGLKSKMNELARDTGGEAFFVGSAKDLAAIYQKIETELRSQYFMSYTTESKKPESEYRTVEVRLRRPELRAKTIRGYFP